jgi:hypothetical protein
MQREADTGAETQKSACALNQAPCAYVHGVIASSLLRLSPCELGNTSIHIHIYIHTCAHLEETMYIGKRDLVFRQKRPTNTNSRAPFSGAFSLVLPTLAVTSRPPLL